MNTVKTNITKRCDDINEKRILIGSAAIKIGSEHLNNCKMKHSGRIPLLSFPTEFSEVKVNNYFLELTREQAKQPINAIKMSLGKPFMRSLFQDEDVDTAIQLATDYYLKHTSELIDDENIRLA
jgi:hypothetical protein